MPKEIFEKRNEEWTASSEKAISDGSQRRMGGGSIEGHHQRGGEREERGEREREELCLEGRGEEEEKETFLFSCSEPLCATCLILLRRSMK